MKHLLQDEEGAALRARAHTLLEIGRYADAIPLLQSCLTLFPNDAGLLCRMAFAFLKMGDLASAMRYAEEAVGANPTEEWGHRLRSVILLEEHKVMEAVQAAEAAIEVAPNSEQSLHALIKALLGAKQKERAEEVSAQLRQISPNSIWTHNGSALAAMHLHQWERVEYHCRASLAIDPELYSELNNLGMALCHLGRFLEAVTAFQEAARLMPTDQTIHQRIAMARSYQRLRETQGEAPLGNIFGAIGSPVDINGIEVKSAKLRRKQSTNSQNDL